MSEPATDEADEIRVEPADAEVRLQAGLLRRLKAGTGWRYVLREFAIIVAGVLCALAAQAWWQGREERGRERDYLRLLLADTRENERRLDDAIATDSAALRSAGRAMDALTRTDAPPPADSLVTWIGNGGRASDFRAVGGNFRALVGTGDLRLVRSDSLRAALAAYAASLDIESDRQRQFRATITDATGPLARSLPFMRRAFLGEVSSRGVDVARLRSDPDVMAVLFTLQAVNANRLNGLHTLRKETRHLRAILERRPDLTSPR